MPDHYIYKTVTFYTPVFLYITYVSIYIHSINEFQGLMEERPLCLET